MKAIQSSLTKNKPVMQVFRGETTSKVIFTAIAGFVLSGIKLFSRPLPIAACFVAALPMGVQAIVGTFSAIVGYFLRCNAAYAAEYTAVTLLMLAAVSVFHGTSLPSVPWFMPLMTAGVSAVLGGLGIIGGTAQIGFLVAKVTLSGLATAWFKKFSSTRNPLLLCTLLASGLCGISEFDFAFLAACAYCCANGEVTSAAVLGLALDLSGSYGQCATVALIVPTLLQRGLPRQDIFLRSAMYLLLPSVVFFCFGEISIGLFLAIFAGMLGGMLLRRFLPTALCGTCAQGTTALEQAAQVLELTCKQLPQDTFSAPVAEAEEVYDAAAERMCRCCPRFHRCWEHYGEQTCEALSSAAQRIIERGIAYAEDFPKVFRDNCCHIEGFVVALNQELEGMLYRRRYRMQLKESRKVLAQELSCLAEYLRDAQDEKPQRTPLFQPQVGICTLGKRGASVSGDKGVCFTAGQGDFFVLLCDGMGTGEAAAESCSQTLRYLQKLLKSGLSARAALTMLNGSEILCGGRYTTVDLLHADLTNGSATLYKWGAAPSYLRYSDEIKSLGEPTTPPGLGISEVPTVHSLCLKRQELLVLVSDGADAENVQSILSSYRGNSPKELAALLAGTAQDDDLTAVAVSLKAVS